MEDLISTSPPEPAEVPERAFFQYKRHNSGALPRAQNELAFKDIDDEMVTYDSPEELFARPQVFSEFSRGLFPSHRPGREADEHERPQTESGLQRYNTGDLFTFDEDENYHKLSVQEKMSHPRWQVRKQLYVDIADSLRSGRFLMRIETELSVFEFFENSLKDMAWDSNLTSQLEGLQTILVYVKLVPTVKNSLFFLADELIQKCALTKQKSGELVSNIVVELMGRDTEGLLLYYIIKRFTAKNPKETCFVIGCVRQALNVLPCGENIGRSLVSGLNKALGNSIAEVRNLSLALAVEVFLYASDDLDTFIKNLELKPLQVKELRETLEFKEKLPSKWTFFNKEKLKTESNDLLILEDTQDSFTVDLQTLIPEGLLDMPYSTEIKINREKLLKFSHSLERPGLIIEKKDYPAIINTLLHLVESNNNLIYTEAIKIIELLVPKISKSFSFKYKHYIQFLSDKFKEKKKTILNMAFSILHLFRVHDVCSFESIVEILLDNVNHKVPQVREYSLNWILTEIQRMPTSIDLLEICHTNLPYEKPLENLVSSFGGKIMIFALKDTIGTVRDAGIRLLLHLRSLLSNNAMLEAMVAKLPKSKGLTTEVKKEEAEVEQGFKDNVQTVDEVSEEFPGVAQKDQKALAEVVEDIKRYSDGVYRLENIMNNIRSMEKQSINTGKGYVISSISWAFFKINHLKLNSKTEIVLLEINQLLEAVIREIGSLEENSLPKLIKMLLQFPAFISKANHKAIESTLDVIFMLSSQPLILESALAFISNLRLRKPKLTQEDKALISLKFSISWLQKKMDKPFVRAHSEICLSFTDLLSELRETDTTFNEHFIKELTNAKISLIHHIKKQMGDTSPAKSRSPNISIVEAPVETLTESELLVREIREIHSCLKIANSSQKIAALHRLMALVEQALAAGQQKDHKSPWKRGIGRSQSIEAQVCTHHLQLPSDILENFIKDLIFLCTKYKNYSQEPTVFEELQHTTVSALTSLRLILSDQDAEHVFRQLLYHLPVKHSNSTFVKTFNVSVYQLFSDWLSHLATSDVIILVSECLQSDSSFNIHIVYIHTLQWFLEIEINLGNFLLEHLSPLSRFIISGLFGGPLNPSHPLSHNTKQLLTFHSSIFMDYLIEVFTFDNVYAFFNENLVNSGKLFNEFQEWAERQKRSIEVVPERFNAKAEEKVEREIEKVVEMHEETKRNLEEVNKEYLNQVTINYELMQRLERREREEKGREEKRLEKQVEIKRTPSFRPCTNFEEVLRQKEEKSPEQPKFCMFDLEDLVDKPVLPYYMQPSEVFPFQIKLINCVEVAALSDDLIKTYTTIVITHKKQFLQFLWTALSNEDVLLALTPDTIKALIHSIMQFCVHEKLSKNSSDFLIKALADSEELELTNELQKLAALLIDSKDVTTTIKLLLQCLTSLLPESFYLPLSPEKKLYMKLLLKCCLKLLNNRQNSHKPVRVFDCLYELNKLFLSYPPESLNSDCSDVAEYEYMFKVLRAMSDSVVGCEPEKAAAFLKFICTGSEGKSVFLRYLTAILAKKHNIHG